MHASGGATPFGGAAAFLGMWLAMMVAMMLPSVAPALWRLRRRLSRTRGAKVTRLTAVAGVGYLALWTLVGFAVHLVVLALASAENLLPGLVRAIPVVAGLVVLFAGAVQLTPWKASQLARCRDAAAPECGEPTDIRAAWQLGVRLGCHCALSCAAPMASLLALGMMEVRAMTIVTAAITLERLLPAGERAARVFGVGGMAAGLILLARVLR